MSVMSGELTAGKRQPRLSQLSVRTRRILFLILLVGCTVMFLAPFLWLLSASLKVRADVFNSDVIPNPIAWENYVAVWQKTTMLTWLKNSVVVGVLAAASVTLSSASVAFGFSYFKFRGRDTLFGLVLATMLPVV